MKISNSKKELASIISENGGWREGAEWAAQDKYYSGQNNGVALYSAKPTRPEKGELCWGGLICNTLTVIEGAELLPNWHQTILSRSEYFHLYPAPDAKTEFCESVTRSIPEPSDNQTIEQLATDYRNAKDYAERKQREADDAKSDAEVKLKALELAGEALGLLVSPINEKQEPDMVITDWRDLRVGDEIEYLGGTTDHWIGRHGAVALIYHNEDDQHHILFQDGPDGECCDPRNWMSTRWCDSFRFIRRP